MQDMPLVWKYVVELEEKDGSMTARVIYVAEAAADAGFARLKADFPSSSLLGQPAIATKAELDASGGRFAINEQVRCVRI